MRQRSFLNLQKTNYLPMLQKLFCHPKDMPSECLMPIVQGDHLWRVLLLQLLEQRGKETLHLRSE